MSNFPKSSWIFPPRFYFLYLVSTIFVNDHANSETVIIRPDARRCFFRRQTLADECRETPFFDKYKNFRTFTQLGLNGANTRFRFFSW